MDQISKSKTWNSETTRRKHKRNASGYCNEQEFFEQDTKNAGNKSGFRQMEFLFHNKEWTEQISTLKYGIK